jgi:hypothetical protein
MTGSYHVGYGRPPRETRFPKGQSGNPRGRPRKSPQSDAILVREVLSEMISIAEHGKKQKLPLRELIERQLYAAATEDAAAGRMLERYRKFIDTFLLPEQTIHIIVRRFAKPS